MAYGAGPAKCNALTTRIRKAKNLTAKMAHLIAHHMPILRHQMPNSAALGDERPMTRPQ